MGKISPSELATQKQTDCCRAQYRSVDNTVSSFYVFSASDENDNGPGSHESSSSPESSSSSETDSDEDSDSDTPQKKKNEAKSRSKVSWSWKYLIQISPLVYCRLSSKLIFMMTLREFNEQPPQRFKDSFSPRLSIKQAISNNVMFECYHRKMVHFII